MALALAIVGATASGKSALAMEFVRARRVESGIVHHVVSLDSMQVYRGMDIGTAKPGALEQAEAPHHLIDLVEPDEEMNLARFQVAYRAVISEIEAAGEFAVLVGGTGLYFQACVDNLEIPGPYPEIRAELEAEPDVVALHARLAALDPVAAARMEPNNQRRVVRALEVTLGSGRPFSSFGPGLETYPPLPFPVWAIDRPRVDIDSRIVERLNQMMAVGFLEEVAGLRTRAEGLSRTAAQALGYRELIDHLERGVPLDDTLERIRIRTRQFARRQDRWFRRDPRVTWRPAAEAH